MSLTTDMTSCYGQCMSEYMDLAAGQKAALHPAAVARCSFYVRIPVTAGTFHYEQISLASSQLDTCLHTTHPPVPGDLIFLPDRRADYSGMFRVIERAWHHAGLGSAAWSRGEALPAEGPRLDVIVEPAAGLFRDEAPMDESRG